MDISLSSAGGDVLSVTLTLGMSLSLLVNTVSLPEVRMAEVAPEYVFMVHRLSGSHMASKHSEMP